MVYYGTYRFEHVHALQAGLLRRKVRATRRPGLPPENPLFFCVRRAWETLSSCVGLGLYWLWLERLRKRVQRDPSAKAYTDAALGGNDLDNGGAFVDRTPADEAAEAA